MFCSKCGTSLPDGAGRCPSCNAIVSGGKIKTSGSKAQTAAADAGMGEMERQNRLLHSFWPDWVLTEKLGSGSFGTVYKAQRNELDTVFYSAIKIIQIPQSNAEAASISAEIGLNEQSTTAYFKSLVQDCVNEIKAMEYFKGTPNIVSVEDYKVLEDESGFGWTIFIRMELLTPFTATISANGLEAQEVIRLGIDICTALEFCEKKNVLHRDIKPANVFLSDFHIYKLGDFGIARKLEKCTTGMSIKGTYQYMAPEVYNGQAAYDFKADVYSLGVMLYKLLNNNRYPLVDPTGDAITYKQMQEAFEQRMSGAALPDPVNADKALAAVVKTACAFRPEDRFPNAGAMKKALLEVQRTAAWAVKEATRTANAGAQTRTVTQKQPEDAYPDAPTTPPEEAPAPKKKKKEKKKKSKFKKFLICLLVLFILALLAAGAVGVWYLFGGEQRIVRALDQKDYSEALSVYNDTFDGNPSGILVRMLKDRLDQTQSDFTTGQIEYEAAMMEISTIEEMNISEMASKLGIVKSAVSTLNDSRIAFQSAETMFQSGSYGGAIENYKKVEQTDPNYNTAQEKLAAAVENYRNDALAQAKEYADAGSYSKALTALEAALETLPEDAKLTEQYTLYQKQNAAQIKEDALKTAEEQITEENYAGAIKTLQTALVSSPKDATLSGALKTYTETFVSKAVEDADALIAERKYNEAIKQLNEALKVLPDDTTLKAKVEEVKAKQPVSLATLNPINGGWKWNEGSPEDPFEVTHSEVSNFAILGSSKTDYSEYRIYKKYNTISGSLIGNTKISETGTAQLKIYADDKLIYTSPEITRKTDLLTFEVDITDADYIKIEMVTSYASYAMLMDVQLWAE